MFVIANEKLSAISGGDQFVVYQDDDFGTGLFGSGFGNVGNPPAPPPPKSKEDKVCDDLARRAKEECDKLWACRNAPGSQNIPGNVKKECHDAFKKAGD